jgi:hypothetical protein
MAKLLSIQADRSKRGIGPVILPVEVPRIVRGIAAEGAHQSAKCVQSAL